MPKRSDDKTDKETKTAHETDLAPLLERLSEATVLLLEVAKRLDQKMDNPSTVTDTPTVEQPKPTVRRRGKKTDSADTTNDETTQAVHAALGIVDVGSDSDMPRLQMNAPSSEVFGRFFGKVLELYAVDLKRQAEARDKRFRSEDREESLREIQATIETVFFSPLVTNAEKNEALRILIKQIIPYEDRIEVTYY